MEDTRVSCDDRRHPLLPSQACTLSSCLNFSFIEKTTSDEPAQLKTVLPADAFSGPVRGCYFSTVDGETGYIWDANQYGRQAEREDGGERMCSSKQLLPNMFSTQKRIRSKGHRKLLRLGQKYFYQTAS